MSANSDLHNLKMKPPQKKCECKNPKPLPVGGNNTYICDTCHKPVIDFPHPEAWELWIDKLMGEKLYDGAVTDFTATHIKDFIRSEITKAVEARTEFLVKDFIRFIRFHDECVVIYKEDWERYVKYLTTLTKEEK